MFKNLIILYCFILSLITLKRVENILYPIAVRLPLNGTPADLGASIWPKPVQHKYELNAYFIHKTQLSLKYSTNLNVCEKDILDKLWSHYKNVLFPPKLDYEYPDKNDKLLNTIYFNLKGSNSIDINDLSKCADLYYPFIQDTEKESYEIDIQQNEAKLESPSIWGLVRGLETFSQLVFTFPDTNKLAIYQTNIYDKPRFYHRGIMIDSARHFMPIPLIKKHLDSMMYNKMNVFHWHLVDDQSFPFESDVYPKLHEKGAFSKNHRYSKKEIHDLIEFARIRGIRIIPEIDTPGHTYSWGLGYPELITVCWRDGKPLQAVYNFHGEREILNPIQNFTYEFVKNLINELKQTFKDPFIHLGMDEVYYRCWESNPNITQFMKENNLNSTKDLEEYYMSRILTSANEIGYKVTVWQDVWDNNVKVFDSTILQIWKSEEPLDHYVEKATKEGYKVLISSPWYLNYIKYGSDWYDFYNVEPYNFSGTAQQKSLILGGEACMWSEYVDGANSLSRLWPRASAVAERLWSEMSVNDVEEAKFRLDDQRCRMLRRGIEAGPIFNSKCGDYEPYMEKSVLNEPVFNYYKINEKNCGSNFYIFARQLSIFLILIFFIFF